MQKREKNTNRENNYRNTRPKKIKRWARHGSHENNTTWISQETYIRRDRKNNKTTKKERKLRNHLLDTERKRNKWMKSKQYKNQR